MHGALDMTLPRTPEEKAAAKKAQAHRQRCKALPPLGKGEAERLVAEFSAVSGVTLCPPAFAVAVKR